MKLIVERYYTRTLELDVPADVVKDALEGDSKSLLILINGLEWDEAPLQHESITVVDETDRDIYEG